MFFWHLFTAEVTKLNDLRSYSPKIKDDELEKMKFKIIDIRRSLLLKSSRTECLLKWDTFP